MLISGRQIKSVSADKVIETENKKFVSQTEKNSWNQKASINDSNTNVSETWSSVKLKQELDKKVNLSDNYSLVYDESEEVLKIVFN